MPVLIDYGTIREHVPMEKVLAAYGIEVRRGKAVCPFHADHRPSMRVYPDGYYCFSCGSGGDVVKFIARMENCPNRDAAVKAAEIGGLAMAAGDYRTRERVQQLGAYRRAELRRTEAMCREYDALCTERIRLDRETADAIPYSPLWCEGKKRLERIEVRLDELFAALDRC